MPKSIALLATGDELVHGDILNTSAPWLANRLVENGFTLSRHMTVTDTEVEIASALKSLLTDNKIVITTGGLGPTSDDRTRFAIANVTHKKLIFDETSWDAIVNRLTRFGLNPTDNNKQQALFPEGANILFNEFGTANGCIVTFDDRMIIMLPGPPFECRGLFDKYVLNHLLSLNIHQSQFVKKWRVFGIGESSIADKVDDIISQYSNASIGYRVDYPYIEIKLFCNNAKDLDNIQQQLQPIIKKYYLADEYLKATQALSLYLQAHEYRLFIEDYATKGYWQYQMLQTAFLPGLIFDPLERNTSAFQIQIKGLEDIWKNEAYNDGNALINLIINKGDNSLFEQAFKVPLRGKRSLIYSCEIISHAILSFLKNH